MSEVKNRTELWASKRLANRDGRRFKNDVESPITSNAKSNNTPESKSLTNKTENMKALPQMDKRCFQRRKAGGKNERVGK